MSNQKQSSVKESDPYDTSFKAMFAEQAGEIIACFLPGARLRQGLPDDLVNVELNRNKLTIDIGIHLVYRKIFVIANVEGQSGRDDDLFARMNEYCINLYRTYGVVIIPIAIILFPCKLPALPFCISDGEHIYSRFDPHVFRMWEMNAQEVVDKQQRCLYMLLPTMYNAKPELLKKALRDLYEHEPHQQFVHHLKWFQVMMRRSTTMSPEDKQEMEDFIRMHSQFSNLLTEDPVIKDLMAESEAKGEAKGKAEGKAEGIEEGALQGALQCARDMIMEIAHDCFSDPVIAQVQQTIATVQNLQQLKKFLRQLARASNDQEALILLSRFFPLPGEIKGAKQSILDIATGRFSAQTVAIVQQSIDPVQDVPQLRMFLRQLADTFDEQAISALLAQAFPPQQAGQ